MKFILSSAILLIFGGLHITDKEVDKTHTKTSYTQSGDTSIWQSFNNILTRKKDTLWIGVDTLSFQIKKVETINYTSALVWDNADNIYKYTSINHKLEPYTYDSPLKEFLKYPIKSLVIGNHNRGCFHNKESSILYTRVNDVRLSSNKYWEIYFQKSDSWRYFHDISIQKLSNILENINYAPSNVPGINQFDIKDNDIKTYLSIVDSLLKLHPNRFSSWDRSKNIDSSFYYNIPKMLDTVTTNTIKKVLDQQEKIISTSSTVFNVSIMNENNETINISKFYYDTPGPWHLPFKMTVDGKTFNCYSITLAQLIAESTPEEFGINHNFDNSKLILEIANYLWNQKNNN